MDENHVCENPYGASHDRCMYKVVTDLGFKIDTFMEGGVERSFQVPIKSVEELQKTYQKIFEGEQKWK